jgi:fucose 4-O-acetylase-like acetyltransferase
MNKRLEYIDTIRGFAIFLVVIGHAIACSYQDWQEVCFFSQTQPQEYMVGGVVWQIIYSFHMALFFMVSGYLSGISNVSRENVGSRLKSKTLRLLVPYLATGYIIYFVRGYWGYWFLLALFKMSILWMIVYVLLKKLNTMMTLWKDVLLMALVYGFLRGLSIFPLSESFSDVNLLKYFIPFCFGCLMRRHAVIEKMVRDNNVYTFCLVLFFLLFISRYFIGIPKLYTIVEKIDFFFSISALCACIAVCSFFMNGINHKFEIVFGYLGRVSMPIYILHFLFVIQKADIGAFFLKQNAATSITMQIVYSLIVSVIAIALSLFIYHILHHSSLIRLLMFGERN